MKLEELEQIEHDENNIDIDVNTTEFLNANLEKSTVLSTRIDDQINILLGLSTAVFIFATSHIDGNEYWTAALAFFSGISMIVGLFAIHPPRVFSQVGQDESILYNKNIVHKFKDARAYSKALMKITNDKKLVVDQYATEIFNVYKYYYLPKRELFKFARFLLVTGAMISFTFFSLHW